MIAFFGITAEFVKELCGVVVYLLGLHHHILTYLLSLGISTLLSILAVSWLFAERFGGIRKCLQKYQRKLHFFDNVLLVIFGFCGCMGINYIIGLIAEMFSLPVVSSSTISNNADIFSILLQTLVIAVIPAICEEIAFRGFVMGSLSDFGQGTAILLSALIFGLLHGNIMSVIFAFCMGILFGFIRKTSGSIIPCMIVHFLNNGFSVWTNALIQIAGRETFGKIFFAFFGILIVMTILSVDTLRKRKIGLFRLENDGILSKVDKAKIILTRPLFWIFVIWSVGICILSMQG